MDKSEFASIFRKRNRILFQRGKESQGKKIERLLINHLKVFG